MLLNPNQLYVCVSSLFWRILGHWSKCQDAVLLSSSPRMALSMLHFVFSMPRAADLTTYTRRHDNYSSTVKNILQGRLSICRNGCVNVSMQWTLSSKKDMALRRAHKLRWHHTVQKSTTSSPLFTYPLRPSPFVLPPSSLGIAYFFTVVTSIS